MLTDKIRVLFCLELRTTQNLVVLTLDRFLFVKYLSLILPSNKYDSQFFNSLCVLFLFAFLSYRSWVILILFWILHTVRKIPSSLKRERICLLSFIPTTITSVPSVPTSIFFIQWPNIESHIFLHLFHAPFLVFFIHTTQALHSFHPHPNNYPHASRQI